MDANKFWIAVVCGLAFIVGAAAYNDGGSADYAGYGGGASSSSGYEVCPGCKGTGACICAGGKGLMHCKKCRICDGSATCVVCDGKGKRPANAYPIVSVDRCFGCFGLGRCGACNGIGENHYGDCPNCQSDGTCGICDGTCETISFMDERGIYQRFSVNGKIR